MKKTLLVLGITFSLLMAQQSHAQTINTPDKASLIASITAQLQKLQAILVVLNTPIAQIHDQIAQIDLQRTQLIAQKQGLRSTDDVKTMTNAQQLAAIDTWQAQLNATQAQIDALGVQEQTLNDDLALKIQYQVQN